jgi:hypothetical protein
VLASIHNMTLGNLMAMYALLLVSWSITLTGWIVYAVFLLFGEK